MTGHVRRRGKASWELKFDAGRDPASGRRVTKFRSFKGTKRQAEIELARLITGAATGDVIDPSKTTVAEFLERWQRDWAAGNVSPKTLERYAELLRLHVLPAIGSTVLQKLRPAALAELYGKLQRDSGLAARTVGHVHRALHRALGHAAQWGLTGQNVAALVSPPRVQAAEITIVRADDIAGLLKRLRGRSIYPVASLAIATGMRRGELLALRWQDVDFDGARLRVEQSLESTKAGLRFKTPKTRHGRRTITLPAAVVSDLRTAWKAAQEQRLALGIGKAPPDALVFARLDGSPLDPRQVTKAWTRAVAAAGAPGITLHALRHTHASQLIAAGLDVLTVSRRLGHGSPTITLSVYGHLFANTDDRAAAVMDATFADAGTE